MNRFCSITLSIQGVDEVGTLNSTNQCLRDLKTKSSHKHIFGNPSISRQMVLN